jgi:hypothetical protein
LNIKNLFKNKKIIKAFIPLMAAWSTPSAWAVDGLLLSDLPLGGDVTVPGDFTIRVPNKMDVTFTSIRQPQTLTLHNGTSSTSTFQIMSPLEKRTRTIKLQPGSSTIYSFKSEKPVRMKVISGELKVNSVHPLKIQR